MNRSIISVMNDFLVHTGYLLGFVCLSEFCCVPCSFACMYEVSECVDGQGILIFE